MKKAIVSTFIFSCMCMLMSCNVEDTFSCDKEIDFWAHQNQEFFESAPRATIVSLPFNLQHAAYVSLSAERKYDLWMAKYHYLQKSEELSYDEKLEVKKLFDALNPEVYNNSRKMKRFESSALRWAEDNKAHYNWDEQKIFYMVGTWMTKEEFDKSIQAVLTTKGDGPEGETNYCTCIYTISCGPGRVCVDGHCEPKTGCGILGTSNCSGKCI